MIQRGKVFGLRVALVCLLVSLGVLQTPLANGAMVQTESSGAMFALHALGSEDGGHLRTELEPGGSAELVVVIGNRDTKPLSLRTYAADAFTLVNGGFGVRDESEAITGPTAWITYSAETYELEPGETIERTVRVEVPANTQPGSYLAGIAAQTAEPVEVSGSQMFDQVIRKAIGLTVVVPGEQVGNAALGEPVIVGDTSGAGIVVPIMNTGNVSVRPAGELVLTVPGGDVVLRAPIAMRPVYAGHITTLEIAIPSHVPAGDYAVSLDLMDEERGWATSLRDVLVTLPDPVAPVLPDPVEITEVNLRAMPDAASGSAPVYADVRVEITNREARIPAAQLTMVVSRDGDVIEEVVLGSAIALLEQLTVVERPWIPIEGWQEGRYTFSLLLESVNPSNGTRSILATLDVPDEIVVAG